ncbi:MAG TPA: Ldh family oxidoreductase [Thermoanaerobacterales bacterium]|nr:Ldh family oxidoreductase [Thermoanaerobacterales bacterium]
MTYCDKANEVTVNHEVLKNLVCQLLEKVNVPKEDALIVANAMVQANLRGVDSHGVRWLDIYLKRIMAGSVKPVTKLKTIREKAAHLLLDAQGGLGQVAMSKGIEMGIEKAKNAGICVVAVRNSNHFGAAGYYSELATKANMGAMVMTNSTPLMAPWGGATLCIGTNPVSFGFPSKDGPVILDMATTAIARGKVFLAAQKGTPLPDGIALNKNGEPTNDAKEALEGILLPVGGPKGYALSLVIDIMAGILTGSNHGKGITSLYGDLENAQDIGHFALLINIEEFLDIEEYFNAMQKSRKELKASKLAKGYTQIYLPGEIESNTKEQRLKNGVVLPADTWDNLQGWVKKFNIN